MKDKIFVQIASYRDPELIPTLDDCIANACYPENLTFCIAWQHGPEETLTKYLTNPAFKIIDIPFNESRGACWARSLIQQKYDGEEFTLMLDSHHRFAKHWDVALMEMYKDLQLKGHKKPLITSYIPSYNPQNDPAERVKNPWKMNFDKFIPEGAVFFMPAYVTDPKELAEPIPARFFSAHFCFTSGQFCKEVPYDPEYYFHGEEISLAVRSFTWGYDLFHPHKIVAWHEYTRNNRIKQWDDDKEWWVKNENCHKRNRILFKMDGITEKIDFKEYGFGPIRSLLDYEKYAGISFKHRSAQKYTLAHFNPPNPDFSTDEEFEKSFFN